MEQANRELEERLEQVEDADNRLEEKERSSEETVSEAEVENWRRC